MTAIPEKTYKYLISEFTSITCDALVDDELYVVDIYEEDGQNWCEVRRLELNNARGWDGLVKVSKKIKITDAIYTYITVEESAVIIQGAAGLVLDRYTLDELFSEDSIHMTQWEPEGYSFIHDGLYYRRRAVLQPVGGIDVVNMKTQSIEDYIDCDIQDRTAPYEGILYGERANGNFALYSLNERKYCFELDCEKYGEEQGRGLRYHLDNGFVYLICGGYILVVDMRSRALVSEIHYASDLMLQALVKDKGGSIADVISTSNGVIALADYGRPGWVGVIDANISNEFIWVHPADKMKIKNAPGDLIYGKVGPYPVAIDKYNGELVWQSKKGSYANSIRVGNSWVVYSTLGGKIQCFKMKKKTYRSPVHP